MAKSEAKSFFSDDRLLIEKYIESPHHIEFQVLCARKPLDKADRAKARSAKAANQMPTPFPILQDNTTGKPSPEDYDVVVFPERECKCG